jgi:acyl carrier protein
MWDEQFETLLRGYLPFLSDTEQLGDDAQLRDLGLDSMGMVELLGVLENTYDVRFLDDALTLETFATPRVLWEAVESLLPSTAR